MCHQRVLQLSDRVKKKAEIIALMEVADDDCMFARFLYLPPELRNRIYQLHFETFEALSRPSPPPLSKVSRQLRQETLVLFFQTCTARIMFIGEHPHFGVFGIPTHLAKGGSVQPAHLARQLFATALPNHLGNIRKLQIEGPIFLRHTIPPASWVSSHKIIGCKLHGS